MDSPKPGQCHYYANVLAISRKMWASGKGIWDKGPDGPHIWGLTLCYLLDVWVSVSSWALGVSPRQLPHVSGAAFWSSWKNERRMSDILVCPHTWKHGKEFPKRLSVSAFPPRERYQCGQVELVQLGRGAEGPSLAPSPWPCLVRWQQLACNQPGGKSAEVALGRNWLVGGEQVRRWSRQKWPRKGPKPGSGLQLLGGQPAGSWGKRGGSPVSEGVVLCLVVSESRSVVSDSVTPRNSWNSPGQNTGVGSLSLLQGIFPTQGSNPGLPHCRQILYQLSQQGSPILDHWQLSRQVWWAIEQGLPCVCPCWSEGAGGRLLLKVLCTGFFPDQLRGTLWSKPFTRVSVQRQHVRVYWDE